MYDESKSFQGIKTVAMPVKVAMSIVEPMLIIIEMKAILIEIIINGSKNDT